MSGHQITANRVSGIVDQNPGLVSVVLFQDSGGGLTMSSPRTGFRRRRTTCPLRRFTCIVSGFRGFRFLVRSF